MRSSIAPILLWGYSANIIYIIGMVGYLFIDILSYVYMGLNTTFSLLIYLLLAIVFIVDAILYTVDWYVYAVKLRKNNSEPVQYRSELIACIFQNLGSSFYLIGSVLAFNKIHIIKRLLFNIFGIFTFLIESIFSLFGWIIVYRRKVTIVSKTNCNLQNIHIWAHTLNIGANVAYLCATILAYNLYITQMISNSTTVILLQIFGDFVYLLDAYLYYECWHLDKAEFDALTEQQNLNQFYLENTDNQNKATENK